MSRNLRVAVLFGGRSAEHEVSLQSAKNIISALDPQKYEPILIGIDRNGDWFLQEQSIPLLNHEDPALIELNRNSTQVSFVSGSSAGALISLSSNADTRGVDIIFPVLHGSDGEDGTVQGLARLVGVPCVSAGVLGSAVSMDKDVAKRLLANSGLSVAPYSVIYEDELRPELFDRLNSDLRVPLFVKPANLGSSVGVSLADSVSELESAVTRALEYDEKVIVEKAIAGREIECAVLGNRDPAVSVPGEVVVGDDGFYSYEKKYIDEHGATLAIPADLDEPTVERVQDIAVRAFRALECRGMARVDMFLNASGEVLVNELNTIPGFTRNSMYPKLWEHSGLGMSELVDRLIQLAQEDFAKHRKRKVKPD